MFNDQDTIIAGTNLFGKADDMISSPDGDASPEPQPMNINVTSVMGQWEMGNYENTGVLNQKAAVKYHS